MCNTSTFSKNILLKFNKSPHRRYVSSIKEAIEKRNHLFNLEKKRQLENVGRIEKIEVNYLGQPEEATLIMNKNLSTPYNCAQHLSKMHLDRSALALVNNEPWDMHRPLQDKCDLDFLHFSVKNPYIVNKAFWRSCSFLLGATACVAFKDKIDVHLHSFPNPQVQSGSFVYDIDLSLDNWTPIPEELYVLSTEMIKFCTKKLPFERLDISTDLALAMFYENKHKSQQIPDIADHNNGNITVYRVGEHVDISKGPMIANTGFLGRITVAAVHKLENNEEGVSLYRFQGVALPQSIVLNHFAYRILENRAKLLNKISVANYNKEEQKTLEADPEMKKHYSVG